MKIFTVSVALSALSVQTRATTFKESLQKIKYNIETTSLELENLGYDLLPYYPTERFLEGEEVCSENCCTMCSGGESYNPDLNSVEISMGGDDDGSTYTCAELAVISNFLSADSQECPYFQALGLAFCGCPPPTATTDGKELCTVCSDGSPLPDPSRMIEGLPFLNDNGNQTEGEDSFTISTCGDAQLGLLFLTAFESVGNATFEEEEDFDICSIFQSTVGPACGCPVNPPGGCNPCPFGLLNPEAEVEFEEDGEPITCEVALTFIQSLPEGQTCNEIIETQAESPCVCNAAPTGTPPAPSSTGTQMTTPTETTNQADDHCDPCPYGLTNPSEEVDFDEDENIKTCGDAIAMIRSMPTGNECDHIIATQPDSGCICKSPPETAVSTPAPVGTTTAPTPAPVKSSAFVSTNIDYFHIIASATAAAIVATVTVI